MVLDRASSRPTDVGRQGTTRLFGQGNQPHTAWSVGHAGRCLCGPALFLASDAADFIHGQILFVDGGLTASY
jgi:hypothetical protein